MIIPGGLYLRSQSTPFVILFVERDGSTYLTSLLISHPHIKAVYERFAVMKKKGNSGADQMAWARSFLTPSWIGRYGALGFKTKLVDVMDPLGFAELLQEVGGHVIQLYRQNHVKAVISKINARRLHERSGNWNLYDASNRMPPLRVPAEELDHLLFERSVAERQSNAYVERVNRPTLKIAYEELLLNRDETLNRVFSFLRVPSRPVKAQTLKHTSDDLRDVLLNFDELRERHRDTDYGPMFDEHSYVTG